MDSILALEQELMNSKYIHANVKNNAITYLSTVTTKDLEESVQQIRNILQQQKINKSDKTELKRNIDFLKRHSNPALSSSLHSYDHSEETYKDFTIYKDIIRCIQNPYDENDIISMVNKYNLFVVFTYEPNEYAIMVWNGYYQVRQTYTPNIPISKLNKRYSNITETKDDIYFVHMSDKLAYVNDKFHDTMFLIFNLLQYVTQLKCNKTIENNTRIQQEIKDSYDKHLASVEKKIRAEVIYKLPTRLSGFVYVYQDDEMKTFGAYKIIFSRFDEIENEVVHYLYKIYVEDIYVMETITKALLSHKVCDCEYYYYSNIDILKDLINSIITLVSKVCRMDSDICVLRELYCEDKIKEKPPKPKQLQENKEDVSWFWKFFSRNKQ